MKKVFLILATLVTINAHAWDWQNANAIFNATTTDSENVSITWIRVDNGKIQSACEAESKRRGQGGFGYGVQGCSFWNNTQTQCTIITPKFTTIHNLGHETLHCFQGNFHK
jgi:hypothetical protein